MTGVPRYLIFANEAALLAEVSTDPAMRDHFSHMAAQWRKLANSSHGVVARRAARKRTS